MALARYRPVGPMEFTVDRAMVVIHVRDCYTDKQIGRAAQWLLLFAGDKIERSDLELAIELYRMVEAP